MRDAWSQWAGRFSALGYPNRLELLSQLREPTEIAQIEVHPVAEDQSGDPARVLTREGIRHHVKRLVDQGFVETVALNGGNGTVHRYRTQPRGIFHASEALISLAEDGRPDVEGSWIQESPGRQGPRLEIVHGLHRGRTFPIRGSNHDEDRGWIVGSAEDADVPLPYDPDVADQHAEIVQTDDGIELVDLRASGPTYHEWRRLDVGDRVALERGDVIGVGRSLLVFKR